MLYVVVSLDFGGSSDVKIHAATARLEVAQAAYAAVRAECDAANAGRVDGVRRLVELARVPADTALLGGDALTLFWGVGAEHNNH